VSLFGMKFIRLHICWHFMGVFEKNDEWYFGTVALVVDFSRKC
jgi:hypothetical protein